MVLTKRQAVWICRRMMKIWHKDLRGDMAAKQEYWEYFLDILYKGGYIDRNDRENWTCPFK
tara:strand:- start:6540 stop:6722 length:183 start_codon:yes stop_codon:yes gene_type:complete